MDIKHLEKGIEVMCPVTGDIGIVTSFRMSNSGLNRVYVTFENNDKIIERPLDLLIKY